MISVFDIKRKNFLFNGVYQLINAYNGKSYVGSCASKTFMYERLIHHRSNLLDDKHPNPILQRAVNKYSILCFYVKILVICNENDCLKHEQFWIDKLEPEYNIAKVAGNTKGIIVSDKRKEKQRASMKRFYKQHPEALEKLRNERLGKKRSKKTALKIALFQLGRKHSWETRQLMAESAPKRKVLNNDTGEIYNSVTEAAIALRVYPSAVSSSCKKYGQPRLRIRKKKINLSYYD